MRILMVGERPDRSRSETDFVESVAAQPGVTLHLLPGGAWDLPDLGDFDAVVLFVSFNQLGVLPPVPWGSYDGLKVMIDHDAFQDFCTFFLAPDRRGEWLELLSPMGLDLLVVSGRMTAAHFESKGIHSAVLPKGFAAGQFSDLGGARRGVGHFGTVYPARGEMLRHVRRAGFEIEHASSSYEQLNATLNRFEGLLICNQPIKLRLGLLGRAVDRVRPGLLFSVEPGPEPMIKNFEATAAGCAVFMDDAPDLPDLGFVDGETAVVYRTFDELVDQLRHWLDRPDDLRRIGRAGAALSAERHTWMHRATELVALVESELRRAR